jgi:hypothetical protein
LSFNIQEFLGDRIKSLSSPEPIKEDKLIKNSLYKDGVTLYDKFLKKKAITDPPGRTYEEWRKLRFEGKENWPVGQSHSMIRERLGIEPKRKEHKVPHQNPHTHTPVVDFGIGKGKHPAGLIKPSKKEKDVT